LLIVITLHLGQNESLFTDSNITYNPNTNSLILPNATANSTTEGALRLTGTTGSIVIDNVGQKRISWNDGSGNFNIRGGHYFNGGDKYVTASDGASAIILNSDSTAGQIDMKVAPVNTGGAGAACNFTSGVRLLGNNFLPIIATSGTMNLGSSSNKWDNVYANNFVGGNADSATKIQVTQRDTDATHYLTFVSNDPDGSYEELYGDDNLSYNPSDNSVKMVRYKGNPYDCVPAYNNTDYDSIFWDTTESAIRLKTSTTDNAIGMAFPAFKVNVNPGEKFKLALQIKSDITSSNGVFIRAYEYDSELPTGKTHVSNNATNPVVQEVDTPRNTTVTYENQPGNTNWQTINFDYTPTSSAVWTSIVVLNWIGLGTNALWVRNLKRESIISGITNIGITTNLAGGAEGSLPYQSATDTTTFLAEPNADNKILSYNNTTNAPIWIDESSIETTQSTAAATAAAAAQTTANSAASAASAAQSTANSGVSAAAAAQSTANSAASAASAAQSTASSAASAASAAQSTANSAASAASAAQSTANGAVTAAGNAQTTANGKVSDVTVVYTGRSSPCTLPITVIEPSGAAGTRQITIPDNSNAFGAKYVQTTEPTGSSVCDGDVWYDTTTSSGGGGFVTGMIMMFSGTVAPTGWALCNGGNGTPDLRNRFIVGTRRFLLFEHSLRCCLEREP